MPVGLYLYFKLGRQRRVAPYDTHFPFRTYTNAFPTNTVETLVVSVCPSLTQSYPELLSGFVHFITFMLTFSSHLETGLVSTSCFSGSDDKSSVRLFTPRLRTETAKAGNVARTCVGFKLGTEVLRGRNLFNRNWLHNQLALQGPQERRSLCILLAGLTEYKRIWSTTTRIFA